MNDLIKIPQIGDFAEVENDWQKFKQKFEFFLMAARKSQETDEMKIALLMNILGDEGIKLYNTISSEESKKSYAEVIKVFEKHCVPHKNVCVEAFKFHNMNQHEGQSIESFITEIKNQAFKCDFVCTKEECKAEYVDRMIKEKIVLGVNNKDLQNKLLMEKDVTLERVIEICKSFEIGKKNQLILSLQNVNAITTRQQQRRKISNEIMLCATNADMITRSQLVQLLVNYVPSVIYQIILHQCAELKLSKVTITRRKFNRYQHR